MLRIFSNFEPRIGERNAVETVKIQQVRKSNRRSLSETPIRFSLLRDYKNRPTPDSFPSPRVILTFQYRSRILLTRKVKPTEALQPLCSEFRPYSLQTANGRSKRRSNLFFALPGPRTQVEDRGKRKTVANRTYYNGRSLSHFDSRFLTMFFALTTCRFAF